MNRIKPLPPEQIPADLSPLINYSDQEMGFAANDIRIMAKWPALLQAMGGVLGTIYSDGEVDGALKRLLGYIASTAAGCRYCQAHTAHGSLEAGTDAAKLAAAWDFETSPLFTAAERAALRVARGGGSQPNGVTDAEFADLLTHYSEQGALEIVAVIALFGFLNRWNETLATQLEDEPIAAAESINESNWDGGKHTPQA
jgi:alkylhydroperoxidase family enzyme